MVENFATVYHDETSNLQSLGGRLHPARFEVRRCLTTKTTMPISVKFLQNS